MTITKNTHHQLLLAIRRIGYILSLNYRFNALPSILRRIFRNSQQTITVNDFNGDITLDLQLSEHMQRRIFWMGGYNREISKILKLHLKPNMTFLDIGANIGELSPIAAKLVGTGGRVYSFEPISKIADQLEENARRNSMSQISVVRKGISNACNGSVPIFNSCGQDSGEKNMGLGSLYGGKNGETPIQFIETITLDSWIEKTKPARIDLIKIDIEGSELPCLQGASKCLTTYRPIIIIEIQNHSFKMAGYNQTEVLNFLRHQQYMIFSINNSGTISPFRQVNAKEYQNVLCMPESADI